MYKNKINNVKKHKNKNKKQIKSKNNIKEEQEGYNI